MAMSVVVARCKNPNSIVKHAIDQSMLTTDASRPCVW
jgi:hypothetical protein